MLALLAYPAYPCVITPNRLFFNRETPLREDGMQSSTVSEYLGESGVELFLDCQVCPIKSNVFNQDWLIKG